MRGLALLWVLIPCVAGAASWKRIFGDYEYSVSIDTDSIERSDGSAKAWVRQHFVKARHSGDYAYDVLDGLNSFDCKNKKVNLLQVDVFQDGKAEDSYKPKASGGDRPIIPGTVEYFAYQYLCIPRKK
jgi:Surface-adhesin protein E